MIELTGNIWVNAKDVVYVRPSDGGGAYIELRNGSGWEDKRGPSTVAKLVARLIHG